MQVLVTVPTLLNSKRLDQSATFTRQKNTGYPQIHSLIWSLAIADSFGQLFVEKAITTISHCSVKVSYLPCKSVNQDQPSAKAAQDGKVRTVFFFGMGPKPWRCPMHRSPKASEHLLYGMVDWLMPIGRTGLFGLLAQAHKTRRYLLCLRGKVLLTQAWKVSVINYSSHIVPTLAQATRGTPASLSSPLEGVSARS